MNDDRARLKREHKELFSALSELLFMRDPIEINFGSNTDEYEPEVGTILPRLSSARSSADVQAIVHEEFCKWFDSSTVGPFEAYADLAEEIWMLWQRHAVSGRGHAT